MRNRTAVLTLSAMLGNLWACGGSSGPSAPTAVVAPTPAPTPQAPSVLLQGAFALPAGFVGAFRTVTAPSSGTLEMTVDWTFAANDLDIAIARGNCTTELLLADRCDVIAVADSATTKPEKLRINVVAGIYTPIALNIGPSDESAALQVVFTPSASGSSATSRTSWKPKQAPTGFISFR